MPVTFSNTQNPYQLEPVFNFAALRLINTRTIPNQLINCVCGEILNDGYGGLFSYDPDSVSGDDNQNIIDALNSKGRWIRVNTASGGGGGGTSGGIALGVPGKTITAGTAVLSNANGVSFGITGQTITASVAPTVLPVFANSNNVSFGLSNGTYTASASYSQPSTAGLISGINVSGGTASNNLPSLVFSNSNNVSFGLSGSTITATVTVPAQNLNVSAGTNNNAVGQNLVFSNSNGVSFGISNNSITASVIGAAQQFSAGASLGSAATLVFSNSNNVSFGLNSRTITASAAQQNINISAGTNNNGASNFIFSNSNNVSFGIAGNTVTASVPTQSLQSIRVSAGGATLLATEVLFQDSNGVSFSLSAGSVIASIANGGNGVLSVSNNFQNLGLSQNGLGNNTVICFPFTGVPGNYSKVDLFLSATFPGAATTNYSGTIKVNVGIYTRSGNTLSQVTSGTRQFVYTNQSNGSLSLLSGVKNISIPMNLSVTAGNYYVVFHSSSTFGGTDVAYWSNVMLSDNPVYSFNGELGQSTNFTNLVPYGMGVAPNSSSVLQGTYNMSLFGGNFTQRPVLAMEFKNV